MLLSEALKAEARRLVRDEGMLPSVALRRVLRVTARQHASRPQVTGALNKNTRTNTEYPPTERRAVMATCGTCADGWICEQHPDQPWPHGDCAGPGVPCENEGCEFAIHKTGLVCPQCRRSSGSITTKDSRVMGFACRECGYRWWSDGRKGA